MSVSAAPHEFTGLTPDARTGRSRTGMRKLILDGVAKERGVTGRGPVLIIEDNPDHVLLIRRALEGAKLAKPIHVAVDGDDALAYLAGQPPYEDRERYPLPTLIVLDLKLPRRSGLEILAWLQQRFEPEQLPVIVVLTSTTDSSEVNQAYALGARSVLFKWSAVTDALTQTVKTLTAS